MFGALGHQLDVDTVLLEEVGSLQTARFPEVAVVRIDGVNKRVTLGPLLEATEDDDL